MSSGGNASSLPLVGGLPEPTIKELSKPGRRAFNYPELDVPEENIEHEAIKTEKAFFGYTYDIGMSELGLHHNGSHNIAIGFLIRTKNTSNTLRHSPFDLNVGTQKIRLKKSSNNKHKSGL